MKRTHVVVAVVAASAAVGSGFLISNYIDSMQPPPVVETVAAPARPATSWVLVAANSVEPGKTLDSTSMEWVEWPESVARDAAGKGAIVSNDAGRAAALKPFEGSVPRGQLLQGEPITETKVVHPDKGGILPLIVTPGYRSMTIAVDVVQGAGGMVQPGDKVDVMLTADLTDPKAGTVDPDTGKTRPRLATETILNDIRVLATDRRLAPNTAPDAPIPANVTLEVTQEQAEKIATASRMGRFAITMRPIVAGMEPPRIGLPFSTDVGIMQNVYAARQNTTADKLDPKENPFAPKEVAKPAVVAAPVVARDTPQKGITIYNATVPTFIPIIGNRVGASAAAQAGAPAPQPTPAPAARQAGAPPPIKASDLPPGAEPAKLPPVGASSGNSNQVQPESGTDLSHDQDVYLGPVSRSGGNGK